MALELLIRNTNFYTYRACAPGSIAFPYSGLCTVAKPYEETITILDSFVYDQSIDRYRFVTLNSTASYPSWGYYASTIHPETGLEESRISLIGYAVAHAWTGPMYNGGLGKVYAGYITAPYKIVEVGQPDGIPTASMIANPLVTATQIPILSATNEGFAISPEQRLITILSLNEGITVYDYAATPALATRLWYHPFPESFGWSMGYEDEQRIWALFSGAIFGASNDTRQTLMKYNYLRNKIELITELQTAGGADRMAAVAWDTKRKKLGAVRIKNDASNGAPNNAFEIYSPRPAMSFVTVPVNVRQISDESTVTFISHLAGTKGEAGGQRPVTWTLT